MKKGNVLVLRKCKKDMISENGFKYPKKGYVEAPDWNNKKECGGGLHGLLWGSGYFDIDDYGELFVVIECKATDVVEFENKCKFKCGKVVLVTESQKKAYELLKKYAPENIIINYAVDTEIGIYGYRSTLTAGYRSTLTACDDSTLTAFDDSTLTADDRSTLTAGNRSTLTAGFRSTLTAGFRSTLTAFDDSTLTAGDRSTLTAGNRSTLTAGDDSTLTAGFRSTLTAGDDSTLTAFDDSTLTAGDDSTLSIYGRFCFVTLNINCVVVIYFNNNVYIAKSGIDFKANIKTKIYVEDNVLKFEEIK